MAANGRVLGIAAAAVAIAAAGSVLWRSSSRATAARAEQALYAAEGRLVQGDAGAVQALQQVNARYGDTPAGTHARVLLAQSYYDQQQYADGVRLLDQHKPGPGWREPVGELRADGVQGEGRGRQAAQELEALAATAGPQIRADLLADAARAYQDVGAAADARRVWEQVLASGIRGPADEARIRLGELNGAAR